MNWNEKTGLKSLITLQENVYEHMALISYHAVEGSANEAGHSPQVQEERPIQQPVLQQKVAESTTPRRDN